MPILPTGPTQVMKTGNVGSVDVFRAAHLFTFTPRGQGKVVRGSWMVSKNQQKLGKPMVCPFSPLGPHRSRKRKMWVLWTFSGRPIYSHLALGGRVMHWEGREWSQKISKNWGSQWYDHSAHWAHRSWKREMWVLWTFSGRPIYSHLAPRCRVMHWEGREWSQKIRKKYCKTRIFSVDKFSSKHCQRAFASSFFRERVICPKYKQQLILRYF